MKHIKTICALKQKQKQTLSRTHCFISKYEMYAGDLNFINKFEAHNICMRLKEGT